MNSISISCSAPGVYRVEWPRRCIPTVARNFGRRVVPIPLPPVARTTAFCAKIMKRGGRALGRSQTPPTTRSPSFKTGSGSCVPSGHRFPDGLRGSERANHFHPVRSPTCAIRGYLCPRRRNFAGEFGAARPSWCERLEDAPHFRVTNAVRPSFACSSAMRQLFDVLTATAHRVGENGPSSCHDVTFARSSRDPRPSHHHHGVGLSKKRPCRRGQLKHPPRRLRWSARNRRSPRR